MTEDIDSFVGHRKLIIAGSGISGLSSAIYATRSNNKPLVLKGDGLSGQLALMTEVDNYPDFPEGVSDPELINSMKEQIGRFGTEICHDITGDVDASERPFTVTLKNGDVYIANVLITVSGAPTRTLDISGEEDLMGYGLSMRATCDGALFRDEKITAIGRGDAAVEEVNFLTKFASTVYLIHRREEFRAEDYQVDHLMEKAGEGEIKLMLNTGTTGLYSPPEEGVDHVTLARNPEGHPNDKLGDPETEGFDFDVGAVFYAIGHAPNASYLGGAGVQRDDDGYIIAKGSSGGGRTTTDVLDIFIAGDVVDYHYQQIATAGGMGVRAALDTGDYLEELEREKKQAAADTAE